MKYKLQYALREVMNNGHKRLIREGSGICVPYNIWNYTTNRYDVDYKRLCDMCINCTANYLYQNCYVTQLGCVYLGASVSCVIHDMSKRGNAFDYIYNTFKTNYYRYNITNQDVTFKCFRVQFKNRQDKDCKDFDNFSMAKMCYSENLNKLLEDIDPIWDTIQLQVIFKKRRSVGFSWYFEEKTLGSVDVFFNKPYGGIRYNPESFSLCLSYIPSDYKHQYFIEYAKSVFENIRLLRPFYVYNSIVT